MKEILELRINYDYAHLLFKADEGKNLGTAVKVVELSKNDPRYVQVPIIAEKLKKKNGKAFYFGWKIKRIYTKHELKAAPLLQIKIKTTFEPAGEECGTMYDETVACKICGANRVQLNPLNLKKGSLPKKDIVKSVAGEVVVSERFAAACKKRNLKGLIFESVLFQNGESNYYQLRATKEIGLSDNTIAGIDPFNLSGQSESVDFTMPGGIDVKFEKEIYKCPKGHTIGLNLLSEPYVLKNESINEYDFFASTQKIGVKRGLLRPEPLYLCSHALRKMVEEEKLSGFEFGVARLE